jgi:hypothetical protein
MPASDGTSLSALPAGGGLAGAGNEGARRDASTRTRQPSWHKALGVRLDRAAAAVQGKAPCDD